MPASITYHIYVTFPGFGETEVFPKNDKISYGWEQVNVVWRKKVNTELWFMNFTGGASQKAFDMFAALELQECGCNRLDMRITLECSPGEETTLYTGFLFFIDGHWYFDICSVSMKPRVNDPFECLFKNWETPKNILIGSGSPVTLTTDTGNFETDTCFDASEPGPVSANIDNFIDTCLDNPAWDWQVTEQHVILIGPDVQVQTKWIRETYTGATPPGDGWTERTPGFWTRPAILHGPIVEEDTDEAYLAHWDHISKTLDNGHTLANVLINLFSVCADYELRSDFLGIDPDGTAPVNTAYQYAEEWIWDAVVFAMSDVIRPSAFQNAAVSNVVLHKLLDDLRENWKLFLYFDEDNNVYRLEHVSYSRFSKLINFVTKRPDAIRGYNSYTYEKTRIPQKETYIWPFPTNDEDWDEASIVYEDCNDVGRIEEHKIETYHTDFQTLVDSGIVEINILQSLCIVSQKDGQIRRAIGDISGIYKLNAGLSWANVVRNLWRWRMPSCQALVNGVERSFISLIPKIRGDEFRAEICCIDILTLHPAIDKVRTGLGQGEIDNVEIDLATGMANWDLLYAPPITLIDLSISISVNDDEQCYYTDFIFQTNEDFPPGVTITWDFGVGAVPGTAIGQGPHSVYYTSIGTKTITVTAEYGGETTTATTTVNVLSCPGQITGNVSEIDSGGIQNVNVKLFNDVDANGVSDGGAAVRNVFTNPSGNYSMATILPGNYVIVLTMPSNYTFVSGQDVSPDGDVAPDPTTADLVIPVTITPNKVDIGNNYLLQYNLGIVKGSVKLTGGAPIIGASVRIRIDADLDGVPDNPTIVASGVTNASGLFTINAVPLGEYLIELILPGGYAVTSAQDNSADGDNPTDLSLTDEFIPLTITFSKTDTDNDFVIDPI